MPETTAPSRDHLAGREHVRGVRAPLAVPGDEPALGLDDAVAVEDELVAHDVARPAP